jgi:hypothetical protein
MSQLVFAVTPNAAFVALLSEVNVCRIFLWFIYICILLENPIIKDHIGGLMVSVRTMNAVYWV